MFAGEVACTFRDGEIVEVLETGSLDSYWSDDSACQCIDCGWSGRVADLRRSCRRDPEAPSPRAARLAEIERQIENHECPRSIRSDVQQMMRMIRQLQKQIQILETISRAGRRQQLVSGSETAIF